MQKHNFAFSLKHVSDNTRKHGSAKTNHALPKLAFNLGLSANHLRSHDYASKVHPEQIPNTTHLGFWPVVNTNPSRSKPIDFRNRIRIKPAMTLLHAKTCSNARQGQDPDLFSECIS